MTGMQAFAVILGLVGLVFALWGLFKASLRVALSLAMVAGFILLVVTVIWRL